MPKIAFICPESQVNANPHLTAVIERFSSVGYGVDIHVFGQDHIGGLRGLNVQVIRHRFIRWRVLWIFLLAQLTIATQRRLALIDFKGVDADLFIGVDLVGITYARLLSKALDRPYALFSYELFFSAEVGGLVKCLERWACKDIEFAVIQDELRAASLAKENKIAKSKMILMPVAAAGTRVPKLGWLRNHASIPHHKRIALFAGSPAPWAGFDRLISGLDDWPEDWCLVVHSRFGFNDADVNHMKSRYGNRIFVSRVELDHPDDLGLLLGDTEVGIALYYPDGKSRYTGQNLIDLGLASGKISSYLRFGIPVIVNQIGEMARHVQSERIGVVVDDIAAVPKALEKLEQDATHTQRRCWNFYSRVLDANTHMPRLLEAVSRSIVLINSDV